MSDLKEIFKAAQEDARRAEEERKAARRACWAWQFETIKSLSFLKGYGITVDYRGDDLVIWKGDSAVYLSYPGDDMNVPVVSKGAKNFDGVEFLTIEEIIKRIAEW